MIQGVRRLRDKREKGSALAFAAVAAAAFLAYGYNSVFMTMVPLYVLDRGWSSFDAGAQGAIFLAAAVAMRFWFGPYADRCGNRRVMLVGLAAFAVTAPLLSLCQEFWQLCCVRCVQAVGLAAFHPCATAEVTELAPKRRVGLALGVFRFATSASLLVGPAWAVMLVDGWGYATCFDALAWAAVGAAVLVLLFIPKRPMRSPDASRVGVHLMARTLKGSPILRAMLAFTLIGALGYGLLMSFAMPLIQSRFPVMNNGLFFSLFSLGGMISTVLIGWACDRSSSGIMLAICLVLLGLGIVLLAWAPSEEMVLASGLLSGFGSSGATVSILASIGVAVPDTERSTALALQQNTIDIGIAAASLGFGAALGAAPNDAVFALWGTATALVGILTALKYH